MYHEDLRQIDKVCTESNHHPILQNVYLHQGKLYAADGYIGARIPVSPSHDDVDGLIPMHAILMARQFESDIVADEEHAVYVRQGNALSQFDRPELGNWPDIVETLNTKVLTRPGPNPETHRPHVILDARKLWRLAQSLHGDTGVYVKLYLPEEKRMPMLVEPLGESGIGAIMPMTPYPRDDKADYYDTMAGLKAKIDNGAESVELDGELLADLRKLLCCDAE